MESEKQDSEQSESMSPCSIGSDKRAEDSAEPQMQEFFAGERMVPESPTMDMPCFVPASTPSLAKEPTRSMTLQPTYGEPITVSEKQPSVEMVEFTTIIEPSEFSPLEVKAHGGDAAMETRDKSGMSTYFETSTVDVDETPRNRAEGYYELSTVGEENTETDSLTQEISYSTLAQIQELPGTNKGATEDTRSFLSPDRNNDCKLSPGKLALDQRSYSLNITIGAMDSSGQCKPRNFSPLATDIMSYTSGSLDDTADYLPVTTPSVEKPSPFPPLILETAASVTSDCSSPPQSSGPATVSSPQPESPGSPEDTKYPYKNGTVMAPDLPEMLDLGTRSRLASDNTDPEIMPKKSEAPAEVFTGDPMASFVAGQLSHSGSKTDSQIEEMGYCVFSEYSGPMPSPADVLSPIESSQVFTPSVLEAKMAEQARKQAVRDTSLEDKNQSIEVVDADIKLDQNQTGKKDADEEKVEVDVKLDRAETKPETIKPSPPTEAFVTPTVTVTLEEGGRCGSEAERQHSGDGSVSDIEIADYERQIRKLEMEDRPLSMEEERELQELREKVKLVHQEAYEEVDAEEMYQLTGVAKDHIAKPAKTSPASSVDSVIDDDKLLSPVLSPAKRQVEAYGSPKRVVSPVLGISKDEAERNIREQKEAEKKDKEEVERKIMEEKQKKEEEQRERKAMEEKAKLEADKMLREEQEIKEREIRKKEEDEKIEKEMKAQREKEDREREEKEKIAKEFEKEKQEREQREKIEKEENERKAKEEREKKEREEKEKEMAEKEKKEKEEKEKKEKEEKEKKEKEEKVKKEKEEKEKKDREAIEKEKAEKEKKEKEEKEKKEKEEKEKKEVEEKAKREKEEKQNQNIPEPKPATSVGAALGTTETVAGLGVKLGEKDTNATEKDSLEAKEEEEDDIEVLDGTGERAGTSTQACKETPEPRAAIESVVTVEDDFITVVQTIDEEGEEPGHSVRFSAPPDTVHHVPSAEEGEECVEEAEEAEMEAGSLEEIVDVPEAQEVPSSQDKAKTMETEGRTESYDRDETTIDDSILDSSWIDTQG